MTNLRCLFDKNSIVVNDSAGANTLAGKYIAPHKGDSPHIGQCFLDENLGFSVMSYHNFKKKGLIERDQADENYYVVFPTLKVKLHFTWIEGILAGSSLTLVKAVENQSMSMPTMGQHYTQHEIDRPSELLSHWKILPGFSNEEIRGLDRVHQSMRNMYSPAKDDLKRRVQNELIDVNFNIDDVNRYFRVFQHDLGALKSRTEDENVHNIPNRDKLKPDQVMLSGDIMTCAGQMFNIMVLVTPGEDKTSMIFGDLLQDHKSETLTASVIRIGRHVTDKYGMNIGIVEFDRQRQLANNVSKTQVENDLSCTVIFVSTHACYAESAIKHIKSRIRAKLSSLVYCVPKTILVHIVISAINNLNMTTRRGNGGKSAYHKLTGQKISYKSYFSLSPSDLVEVHVKSNNDVQQYRSVTAIPLLPTHNNHSDWTFFSLETGQLFIRDYRHARRVPFSHEARLRMKYLTQLDPVRADDQINLRQTEIPRALYEMKKHQPQSTRRRTRPRKRDRQQQTPSPADHNNDLDLVEEEEAMNPEVIDNATDDDIEEPAPDPADMEAVIAATTMLSDDDHALQAQLTDMLIFPDDLVDDITLQKTEHEAGVYTIYSSSSHADLLNTEVLVSMNNGKEIRAKERSQTPITYKPFPTFRDTIMVTSLAGKKTVSNLGLGVQIEECSIVDYLDIKDGCLFATQVTARNALKAFGEEGIRAIRKEIDGLLSKKVFTGVLKDNLTETQRKKIIRMSCFIKEKKDSNGTFIKLKARLVAGGHQQDRTLYNQDETSSPTVATSSVFSIISTGISESRKFMSFDISQAYLNADMKDEVLMTLDPAMTKILLEQDKSGQFKDKVSNERVTVKLNKALYGCIQSAKLWYNHLSDYLRTIGFSPNPVDPCVFNRMTRNQKQTTLAIHVDDGLTTSEDADDLMLLQRQLREKFGEMECNIAEDKLEYLGMEIDISDGEKATLTMKKYVSDVISENGITATTATPASPDLFKINESPILDEDNRQCFHRVVAQLLYLATRTRPDILLPITFLCSRVAIATEEDADKLKRVLSYLNNTRELGIVIGHKGEPVSLSVYADASYAVHGDYKSHGGIVISHNRGPVLVKCSKQKIVTKSSTEAELVTLSDATSLAAYNIEFLKGQGYNVNAVLHQDNTSCISLAENGRSNSDRTKHIGIRYFFVKQYIENGSMKIEHCPTLDMVADILTKPLQGEQFRRMRDLLLGYSRKE